MVDEKRRRKDAIVQSVFDSMLDAIVVADDAGHIQYVNAGAEQVFGYSHGEMVGASLNMLMPSDVAQHHGQYLRAAAGGERAAVLGREREIFALRKNGERFPVEISIRELHAGDSRMFTAVVRDVTQRKQRLESLRLAKEQAEETAKLKSQFLATMSHEIRTPMNGVLGMLELLRDTPLDVRQQESVDIASSCGKSLMLLLNDILDFSKIESSKLELESIEFDLGELVDDVLALLATPAREKGLDFACLFGRDLPMHYQGDPNRIRQVLTNLVGNALKFTAQGEIVVHVSRVAAETDGGVDIFGDLDPVSESSDQAAAVMLRFDVVDTGIGIAADNQRKLFQVFQQADGSTSRRFGGTGLGLAICKKLVEAMGGQIGVYSEPGVGANFWFSVPLPAVSTPISKAPTVNSLAGKSVILAEARPASRSSLESQISRWSMHHFAALNEADLASRISQGDSVDVVLVGDLGRNCDVLEIPRAVRAARRGTDVKLVLISANHDPEDEQRARAAGYDAYVTKPVRAESLRRVLCSLLSQGAAAKEACASRDGLLSGVRVLVVDDHPVNQKVAMGLLGRIGVSAEVATNGQEALDRLAVQSFDLVLMDVQMPVMDGYQAAAAVRATEQGTARRTPIVAMTAMSQDGDAQLCLEAGMDGYLSKPITTVALRAALERWVPEKVRPL